MSLDTKLILEALNKHFDEMDAKWDRWFAAQDARWNQRTATRVPAQVSSELPTPALATTTSSSAPTPAPAARAAVVDNTNNSSPTTCSMQVSPTDPEAPACVAPAPTISAVVFPVETSIECESTGTKCVDCLSLLPAVLLGDIISRLPIKSARPCSPAVGGPSGALRHPCSSPA